MLVDIPNILQIILGFFLVFIFPGFAIVEAIFSEEIQGFIDHITLTIGLSLITDIFLALGLQWMSIKWFYYLDECYCYCPVSQKVS